MQAAWLLLCLVQETAHAEDFEERVRLDAVHDGWERVRSDRHPAWNLIHVARDPKEARSGDHFLLMETQGGHTALQQAPAAAWTVNPERPYRLRGWTRLDGTRRNTARFTLVWLDARLRPLREDRSEPVAESGDWTQRVLEVPRPPREARRAAVRLDFEGPDFRGECRFDRISLEPAVLVRLSPAGSPPGVFEPESFPRFDLEIFGLAPGEGTVRVVTRPPGGAPGQRLTPRPAAAALALPLPRHPPGLYEVEAAVEKGGLTLAQGTSHFFVPAPWTGTPPARPLCQVRFDPAVSHATALSALAGSDPEAGAPSITLHVSKGDPAVRAADLLHALVPLAAEGMKPGSVLVVTDGAPAPLAALRVFHDLLSGTEFRPGLRPFPADLHPHAFEKDGRIVLALWSERPVEREIHLGDGVRLHPPLGAPRPLPPGERLALGPLPVFLSGIDPGLLALLQGFELSDPVLPLQRAPVLREVRFREPVDELRIRLLDPLPPGWIARPRDVTRELTLLLPASAAEGSHDLAFEISFVRDGKPGSFRAVRSVRVEPRLELSSARTPAGALAVTVANRSGAPRTLLLRIRVPGRAEATLPLALPDGGARTLEVPAGAEVDCEERGGDRLHARLTR